MKIEKNRNVENLVIALEGRLDTTTAPQLEEELKNSLEGVTELVFDLGALEYISSAGLLATYKTMRGTGSIQIINANELVQEVFEVTGLSNILPVK